MISRIHIKNFQSHKDSELVFDPGFNSIIGSTDSGKSAIYRAIYWTRFNKATNFVSFWNRRKNGDPIKQTSVTIQAGDHVVERIRSPILNGYEVDGEVLAAIGRGDNVEKVQTCLDMQDTSFFSQHNPPFLLTETAGKVAEMFNELIRLDDIDRILTDLDGKKRKAEAEKHTTETTMKQYTDALAGMAWVQDAEDQCDMMEIIEKELQGTEKDINELSPALGHLDAAMALHSRLGAIWEVTTPLIEELSATLLELEVCVEESGAVARYIDAIDSMEQSIERLKSIDADADIEYCDSVVRELNQVAFDLEELASWMDRFLLRRENASMLAEEYVDAIQDMPDSCPVCGKPFEVIE